MRSLRTWTLAVAATVLAGGGLVGASPVQGAAGTGRLSVAVKDNITGGSFETPVVAPYSWFRFSSGQSMGGWQVTSGSVELVDGHWQAADGQQSVDLSGAVAGSISQTFPTTPGSTYVVTYALAGNPSSPTSPIKTGRVLVDGQEVQAFSVDTTGKSANNLGYVTKRVVFEAGGTSTTLAFASTTAGTDGPVIDKVSVIGCNCGA